MKHEVKVGDRFRLGAWEWGVIHCTYGLFRSSKCGVQEDGSDLWLSKQDADSLDWIKPEVTFTKKQTEELKSHYIKWHRIAFDYDTGRVVPEKSWFIDWLDEHTEKE
jgi:hypothetical protein